MFESEEIVKVPVVEHSDALITPEPQPVSTEHQDIPLVTDAANQYVREWRDSLVESAPDLLHLGLATSIDAHSRSLSIPAALLSHTFMAAIYALHIKEAVTLENRSVLKLK